VSYYCSECSCPKKGENVQLKESFYEELERVFGKLTKHHMKILLGNVNAKEGREDILKANV
jgi:exonuclease III